MDVPSTSLSLEMDVPSTRPHQKSKIINFKLFSKITVPLILLIIIPLQLANTITFKKSPEQDNNHAHVEQVYRAPPRHRPLPRKPSSNCDLSSGEWVPNPDAPYYTNTSCSVIHEHQNCMKYGRPDSEYMKWKWKPNGCDLPIFNPKEFFEIVKGKSLVFVGDSVARNHVQSLICILSRVEYPIDVSYKKNEPSKRWYYQSYNFTLAVFWSPFLVKTQESDPINGTFSGASIIAVNIDEPDEKWTTQIDEFDYIVISAGHWFLRSMFYFEKAKLFSCRFCKIPNSKDYHIVYEYRKVFQTALRVIVERETFKGAVYLRTITPSHFEGGDWNQGGNCTRQKPYKSKQITLQGIQLDLYKAQLEEFKEAQKLGRKRGLKLRVIDMTQPMLLRPDGHPSRYGRWPLKNVTVYDDCVHWCLPGPIDTWNDFLLEMIRTEGMK